MPIIFYTSNLNEKMYTRLIRNILLHIDTRPNTIKPFLDNWTIMIRPLSHTDLRFFQHIKTTSGQTITNKTPSGVTGQYTIDLFMHDVDDIRHFMENSDRIQHEICHAKLYKTPKFVSGVHSKILETTGEKIKSFKIFFWTNRWKFWQRIPINIIDIREDIKHPYN